jgi:hypothetical protein
MSRTENEVEATLNFLQRVKEGEYAPIETSSLQYVRIQTLTENLEEFYYYGIV